MLSTGFTKFRRNAAAYLDKVEHGETVIVTRHGRPIAEISAPTNSIEIKSWKRPALRLPVRGISLSKAILSDRRKAGS
jgi:antitoxin (DNA-binding transcriptional repressor) of toxin-antitoxin stability system